MAPGSSCDDPMLREGFWNIVRRATAGILALYARNDEENGKKKDFVREKDLTGPH